jgi:hypothetical protein
MVMTINVIEKQAVTQLRAMERSGLIRFTPVHNQRTENSTAKEPRIGFLKGKIAIPADFDTMGQAEIAALFQGAL